MEPNFNPYSNVPEDNHNDFQKPHTRPNLKGKGFETAALILGGLSLFSCLFIYGAYVCGALAILFALLSKGGERKMSSRARLGFILGMVAIVLSTVLTVGAFMIAMEQFGSIENMLREYCNMYGLDFEQEFGILFQ